MAMSSLKKSGGRALLDQVYDLKFDKAIPLAGILLSGIYAIFRSTHYLSVEFKLPLLVAIPTSFFIELLVLSAGALVFISLRQAFIKELENQDRDIATAGVYASLSLLAVSFVALVGMAIADADLVTQAIAPTALMAIIQIAQCLGICVFVVVALLDERADLRLAYRDGLMKTCPHCQREVTPNNRSRHIDACPLNPANQASPPAQP